MLLPHKTGHCNDHQARPHHLVTACAKEVHCVVASPHSNGHQARWIALATALPSLPTCAVLCCCTDVWRVERCALASAQTSFCCEAIDHLQGFVVCFTQKFASYLGVLDVTIVTVACSLKCNAQFLAKSKVAPSL